ncbi:MAG: PAS domain-containing protein [Archangiaceae bacterium]|nr:PAS domain-containing protein [Archangiaceae bacterium]
MLVAADGSLTVSDGAARIDGKLLTGINLAEVKGADDLLRDVEEARREGIVERSLKLWGEEWQGRCERSGSSVFVTLTREPPLTADFPRIGVELVDLLLSGQPLPRVLDELCQVAEGSFPTGICSVLLLGPDGLLHVGAGPRVPPDVRLACENLAPGLGQGGCGEAVFLKRPVFVRDTHTDARFEAFRRPFVETGLRACWSWPVLTHTGDVLGTFAVYGRAAGQPSDVQLALMGTLVRLAALAIDHHHSLRATREMLERYHLVAEASTNVIYDWNLRSNHLEWSPRMKQVFGYDTPLLGFDWWESCVHPAEREHVSESLQRAIAERRKTWSETYRFRRQNGTWATVIDRGHLLFDEAGTPARLIGEMSDISGQQMLQARLALSERLASVGTLAAGVAHEINNPLAWISSNLHFAIDELKVLRQSTPMPVLDEVAEALNDARTGSERVSTIVRDLKLFSRAQDDQATLIDVRRVLESAITMARNEIRHRAHLERRFAEVPMVKGNEGKLSQVFLNLLINAAHALPEGDVSNQAIIVSTEVDERGLVRVMVSDTGKGIEPDVLPHIFDPFFTTKPVGQGTGLGLSICHTLVSGLGGTIHVDSAPGRGSTFTVSLPVAPPEARKSPLPMFERLVVERGIVALIDDEPSVLLALQRVLGPHHEVKSFTQPLHALEALPALHPDVIFCDVMMPEMSGAEIYNRLRATHPTLAERLIFMTGGAFSSTAREFLDEVQRPILDKPFTAEAVRKMANEQVARARAAG